MRHGGVERRRWRRAGLAAVAVLAALQAQPPAGAMFTAITHASGLLATGYYAFDRAGISTLAGTGVAGFNGDNQPAVSAQVNNPTGLAVDGAGAVYVADFGNNGIRKVSPDGTISTVAGSGTAGYAGDGGPATVARLSGPRAVLPTSSGGLYIADGGNNCIRYVNPAGTISTVAGNGTAGYGGDNGPATAAALNLVRGMALAPDGRLVIADTENHRLRVATAAAPSPPSPTPAPPATAATAARPPPPR